jgi:hypothetical protein
VNGTWGAGCGFFTTTSSVIASGEFENSTSSRASLVIAAEASEKPLAISYCPDAAAPTPTAPEASATPPSGTATTPDVALSPLSPIAPTARLVCLEAAEKFWADWSAKAGVAAAKTVPASKA